MFNKIKDLFKKVLDLANKKEEKPHTNPVVFEKETEKPKKKTKKKPKKKKKK